MKFTDDQLSRVLTAHLNGELARGGMTYSRPERMCLFEAAEGLEELLDDWGYLQRIAVADFDWFDAKYNTRWSPATFLAKLAERGLT